MEEYFGIIWKNTRFKTSMCYAPQDLVASACVGGEVLGQPALRPRHHLLLTDRQVRRVGQPADADLVGPRARVNVVDQREVAPVRPEAYERHREQRRAGHRVARAVGVVGAAEALGLVSDRWVAVVALDAPVALERALACGRVGVRAGRAGERALDRRGRPDLARAARLACFWIEPTRLALDAFVAVRLGARVAGRAEASLRVRDLTFAARRAC